MAGPLHPTDWKLRANVLGASYRRRAAISIVAAVVLVALLSGAALSLVSSARGVSAEAQDLSNVDELLRTAAIARSQVAVASLGFELETEAGLSAPGPTTLLAIDEADVALDRLAASGQQVETLTGLVTAFTGPAGELTTALRAGSPPEATARIAAEDAYAALSQAALELRETSNEVLASDGERMAALGRIAGLIISLAVPALGVLAYRLLTVPPSTTVELAHAADTTDRRARRHAAAVRSTVVELERALGSDTGADGDWDGERSWANAAGAARRLRALAEVADGAPAALRPVDIELDIIGPIRQAGLHIDRVTGEAARVMTDPDRMVAATSALLTLARRRDGAPTQIDLDTDGDGATIAIGLRAGPLDATLMQPGLDLPGDEADWSLAIADWLVTSVAGSLTTAARDDGQALVLRLPLAAAPAPGVGERSAPVLR